MAVLLSFPEVFICRSTLIREAAAGMTSKISGKAVCLALYRITSSLLFQEKLTTSAKDLWSLNQSLWLFMGS